MSPAHGSARLLMASTAARGCLLHLAVPFHLLFWKACFGGDPGINSLCEANDFQKCMTGFFVGSPPPPSMSFCLWKETVHLLVLAGRNALGEYKLTVKTLNLRCTSNHSISAFAVCSAGVIYHGEA